MDGRAVSTQLALHEAAHAVVARHFGLQVVEIRIGEREGATLYSDNGTALQQATVTAAGEVGQKLVPGEYRDLACADLAVFEREHGLSLLWQAQRDARSILTARRMAFMALAQRLDREQLIRFDEVEAPSIVRISPPWASDDEVFR